MKISEREKQIICLLCYTDRQIAEKLNISIYTVKTYIRNLFYKLFAENRQELLMKAIQKNCITIQDVIMRAE